MQLPPLPPSNNFQSYVSGDVAIDPSAAIAPGVILIADANSRITIGAGVCIGMGSIVEARGGILEIEAGAVLGAGVLAIGKGKIGANACIGSATTIFNSSVEARQVVPPGSSLGDTSRQISQAPYAEIGIDSDSAPAANKTTLPTIVILPYTASPKESSIEAPPPASANTKDSEKAIAPTVPNSQEATTVQFSAYGQANLNRLLVTLFPQKQSIKLPIQDSDDD